jgi:uncharacterized repeat protein (TIGR04138 family)
LDHEDLTPELEDLTFGNGKYKPRAYMFVIEALEFTMARLGRHGHVSGQELSEGVAHLAKREFGPTAKMVLENWGITETRDIGEIVFTLVSAGLLGKTEEDSIEDFVEVYDFDDVFERQYDWKGDGSG